MNDRAHTDLNNSQDSTTFTSLFAEEPKKRALSKINAVGPSESRAQSGHNFANINVASAPQSTTPTMAAKTFLNSPVQVQTKLEVGAPNDKYEQEADRVAEQVMRMPKRVVPSFTKAPEMVQRTCAQCEEEEEEGLL